jgi:hypothetical protein
MPKNSKKSFIHVKVSGGATAQILGLINAIYVSEKLRKPFKISYYPYSTGTFWPCILEKFLAPNEILNINVPTPGLSSAERFEVGKIIESHPLTKKNLSIEKIISILRRTRILKIFKFYKRELEINADVQKLRNVTKYYRTISGGFAGINDKKTNQLIHERFVRAGVESPFQKKIDQANIVLHYRLGDKRATFNYRNDFNNDLIIDPATFFNVLNSLGYLQNNNIYVVSDDPILAKDLLTSQGIKINYIETSGSIWKDLFIMSQAAVFIGSNSQVSLLANICVENNGGKSYLLNSSKRIDLEMFPNTTIYKGAVLPLDHSIYSFDFILPQNSHSEYKNK